MTKDDDLEVFDAEDCPQGSDAWRAVRRGWPSASRFATAKAGGEGLTRDKYMRQLAGEQITGLDKEDDFASAAMERGAAMEPELRAMYAMLTGEKPEPIGFMRRRLNTGFVGASPDSLVGRRKVVEFKSAAPHVLIDIMRDGRVPPEHIPQCQGVLLVSGRAACDLFIGHTGMRPFIRTIPRDEAYIARMRVGLETFNEELIDMVKWVKEYRS